VSARLDDAELDRLRPQVGARFLLQLDHADGASAHYRGWVLTAAATWSYAVELSEGGDARLDADGAAAPPEHDTMLTTIARLTARGAARKRADGLPPWPDRVLRWRGPGRGA